jgi:branched-chain amino acid transport system ATP-binding protein
MLEVSQINTYYGIIHVLFDVSLSVNEGEVVALLGRNGTGKTTFIRSVMGLTPFKSGSIKFHKQEIKGLPPFEIARRGIGLVPEGRRIFGNLTVRENLLMGRIKSGKSADAKWDEGKCYELFPVLKEVCSRKGDQLSGGQQQMLTIARTLMGNPSFVMLDEPCEGLSPMMTQTVQDQLHKLKEEKIAILLAGQDVGLAKALADRIYLMDKGQIQHVVTSDELKKNDEEIKRYMQI